MSKLLPLLLLWLSFPSFAQDANNISSCGNYEFRGIVRPSKSGPVIVVNEKSQSEFIVTVTIPDEAALAPYIDRPVSVSAIFEKKISGNTALGRILKIQSRIPNPLVPMDTGIKLISKSGCKK